MQLSQDWRPRLRVVGIGDDGPASLGETARATVASAEVLCGGERHLAGFPDHPAERLVVRAGLAPLVQALEARRRAQRVVVLASGDPLFYGIGATLADRLGRDAIEVLPNVSAIQLAFARLSLAWHDATLLSAHGRPLAAVLPAALRAPKVAFLTDLSNTPGAIARAMLAAGADDGAAHVLEHLGGPHERRFSGRLSEVAASDFGDLNLLVVEQPPLPRRSRLGLPDDAYAHRGGQLTKRDVRVAALARLAPRAGGVVWDVGAGCGSVAIEAASLVGDGWVYAVERDPEQLTYLRVNRQRHRAANVEVVAGEAPAALAALPDPDAVFVGGGGGQLAAILEHAATRLRPAGRLVVNAATLDTVERVRRCARDAGWPLEVVQVAVGVGVPVGTGLRLAAQNPVFILTLTPGTASPHPLALASPATTPEEDQ